MKLTSAAVSFLSLAFLLSCGSAARSPSSGGSALSAAGYNHGGSSGKPFDAGADVDPDCAKYGSVSANKPEHGAGSLPASLRGRNGEKQCACRWDMGLGVGLMCQTGFNKKGDHNAPYCVTWISCK